MTDGRPQKLGFEVLPQHALAAGFPTLDSFFHAIRIGFTFRPNPIIPRYANVMRKYQHGPHYYFDIEYLPPGAQ